jgi:hypothetical protein
MCALRTRSGYRLRNTGEPSRGLGVPVHVVQKDPDLVSRKDYSASRGRVQAARHNSATGTNPAASDPQADSFVVNP